ncbi:glycosyltransferase family 2 protein [Clostridium celatum]|uniref:glycosyltransferase family 2 protein n=1 Tax=Clostridium celatum TaxID=36834 RepID=UPI001899AE13|nr:glycosyltransferase family 2 protein [Clostridium celatum]
MKKPQLSIIMPVYNAERYLNKCIESILGQSYNNFELIIINDGSIDGSKEICEYYSANDKRVKVINKTNEGQSAARNDGLKLAKGQYIQFIDADDWLELNACETLIKNIQIEEVDWVLASFNFVGKNRIEKVNFKSIKYNTNEFVDNMTKYLNHWAFNVLWNKIYKKEIIVANSISFTKELNYSEDLLFNLKYMKYSNSISIISNNIYNYNKVNEKSSTKQNIKNMYYTQKKAFEVIVKILRDNKWDNKENIVWIQKAYVDVIYSYLRSVSLIDIFKNENLRLIFEDIECKKIMRELWYENGKYTNVINFFYLKNQRTLCILTLKLYNIVRGLYIVRNQISRIKRWEEKVC